MIEKWLRKPLYKYDNNFDQLLLKEKVKFGIAQIAEVLNLSIEELRDLE
jgi:hypothetical protein